MGVLHTPHRASGLSGTRSGSDWADMLHGDARYLFWWAARAACFRCGRTFYDHGAVCVPRRSGTEVTAKSMLLAGVIVRFFWFEGLILLRASGPEAWHPAGLITSQDRPAFFLLPRHIVPNNSCVAPLESRRPPVWNPRGIRCGLQWRQ
jgi:hypothetical protein